MRSLLWLVVVTALPAQQQLWQITSNATDSIYGVLPFDDWNRDGRKDFLCIFSLNQSVRSLQLRSGADAALLWQQTPSPYTGPMYAGDVDGDGKPDLAVFGPPGFGTTVVAIYSMARGVELWQNSGLAGVYGLARIANIDVNGDKRMDFITCTSHSTASDLFVYDSTGVTLYTLPMLAQGRIVDSMANMGDLDGDNCDDFVLGCAESTGRGVLRLVSGRTGATLRESFGIAPGDRISAHASNLGDIDGDGVNDYAGFPYWSATYLRVTAFSGATGAVLHTWWEYANSVVTGQDFDLDGVPDLVMGADWLITSACNGSTRCYSGRDGTLLWQFDNAPLPPGTGSCGQQGWMESSTSLGVHPGSPYPVVAWWDYDFYLVGNYPGRIRSFSTARAGQGPVTGAACASTGQPPQIGTRQTAAGARVTIAKARPGAMAWLNLNLANQTAYGGLPLPIDLTAIGFTGCSLHVGPAASYFRALGTSGIDRGYAAVDLPFQLTSALNGVRLAAQWIVLDPVSLDYAFTQKHELRVQ